MKNRGLAIILALSMIFSIALTGCGQEDSSSAMIMVGVAMANQETSSEAGEAIKTELEAAGYTVELAYADSGSSQADQISAMVEDGASILVVDPVDTDVAKETLESITVDVSDVVVIAYRDPLDTDYANAYVGRDYYEMGKQQAEEIVTKLSIATRSDCVTVEMVAGKGSSAEQAVQGAMDVLQPYIDTGVVKITSGNITAAACQTDDAAAWTKQILADNYTEEELRAILCLGEGQAVEVVDTILTDYTGIILPTVVGADCTPETLQYMSQGLLDMVSICDTDELVSRVVDVILNVVNAPDSVEKETLLENTVVTVDNYSQLLVDSGLYTANNDGTFTKN